MAMKAMGFCAPLALALALSATPAAAEEGMVGELKGLEVERGIVELESRLIHVHRPGEDLLALAAAASYGLSDRVQIGAEMKTANDGRRRKVEEASLFAKWNAAEFAGGAGGLGVQAGLVVDPASGAIGSETFFIAEARAGEFDLTGNLLLLTEPGDWSELSLAYGGRGSRVLCRHLTLGVEAGGTLTGEGKGSHFAGPVLNISPDDVPLGIELGLFGPLSSEAPDFQMRLQVGLDL
jgi:hypothetical protein